MDGSMSTPATSASASSAFYCGPCRRSFAGKKEYDRHMRNAKAHSSGITCYHPGCSKTYQKWESLYTHVGRDHRDEIEPLLSHKYESMKEGRAPQQHVASGRYGTSFLTGAQYIVDDSHARFRQMAGNTPVSSDVTTSVAHEAGLPTIAAPFAGPQHMYGNLGLCTGGTGVQQTLTYGIAHPYTTIHSSVGMSTASWLPPSASQLGASSTPAGSLDQTYPALGMLPTSASSYAGFTGQFGDNYQSQENLAMGAAYSGPYIGSPDTMLDDDAENSRDDYI